MLTMTGASMASASGTKRPLEQQQAGGDLDRLQQREEVAAAEQRAGEGERPAAARAGIGRKCRKKFRPKTVKTRPKKRRAAVGTTFWMVCMT